jgi:hypothetical protein
VSRKISDNSVTGPQPAEPVADELSDVEDAFAGRGRYDIGRCRCAERPSRSRVPNTHWGTTD